MKIKILSVIIIVSFFLACIEEFRPKIDGYVNLPVVEGTITNEPGPYVVRLSKSLTTYDLNHAPITGATIIISDDLNTEETLIEINPGVYKTDSLGIRGIVGRKYRLSIKINGKTYQSNFEELLEPLGIDSVYTKIENQETLSGNFEGIQFYINTEDSNDKNIQLLWKLIETYKYSSELEAEYLYFYYSDSIAAIVNDSIDEVVNINNMCWDTGKVKGIYTYSPQNLTDSKVNNIPLHYVSTDTKKLSERYSLLVNQYSISKNAYEYWNTIKKQNAESSSFYTTQPFQIKGNLRSIENEDDEILGYFMAAGKSQKRIYINRPPLKFKGVCEFRRDYFLALIQSPQPPRIIYVTQASGGWGSAPMRCLDCREEGGSLIKPEFWEN